MKVFWKPTIKQTKALLSEADETLYGGARGGGKDIHINTNVLTNRGWIKAKDVNLNDKLVAIDGSYTKIKGIYPKKNREMYKITFIDGRNIVCDAEHNWSVYSKGHGHRDGWIVKKTKDLLKNPKNYSIPLLEKTPGKKWNGINPYIVGYILGDGTLTSAREIIYTIDEETIKYLKGEGWSIHNYSYQNTTMCNPLKDAHKYQDLIGRVSGKNKYIPEVLLNADNETRLKVLQGLMDSDGHCDNEGRASFSNKSFKLCKGLQYIVRSLGGKAVIHKIERGERKIKGYVSDGKSYKVSVSYVGKFKPFKMKRKADRLRMEQAEDKLGIISIEKVKNADGVCFEVEHKEHLFIVEDFIVTHNTDAGMVWMIEPKYVSHPKYRGLVIRKNSDDLKDWVDRARRMYAPLNAVITGIPAEIKFPSGAIIRTGHLKDAGAYTKYQGHEYHKILFEELTKIPRESDYEKMIGSCRSTVKDLKARVFATTNPDGDGYEWVKERWDCGNPDEKVRESLDKETGIVKTRLFIPAKVDDNPHLIEADPGYVAYLNNIKDLTLRKQWRDGSWEEPNVEGAYYLKQINQAQEENRITSIPKENMLVDTWWDLGISDSMSIWFTQSYGNEIRVIDYYENEGEGIGFYLNVLKEKGYNYGGHYAPHDIEVRELTTGVSRKDTAKLKWGINFNVVPKLPISDGIDAVREILPRCYFDEIRCKDGLRCLKNYKKEFDDKMNCFKQNPLHNWASHGADAFRTMAVGYNKFKNSTTKKPYIPNKFITSNRYK